MIGKIYRIINIELSKFTEIMSLLILSDSKDKTKKDEKRDMEYFKNNVFYKLAILFIVLGLFPICYGSYMFFKDNNYLAGIIELLIYLVILMLIFTSRISTMNKRYIFVLCVYFLGLMLLFITGPMGAGLIVIVSTFGLAACLLNKRNNVIYIFISLFVFIVISLFLHFGFLENLAINLYNETWYIMAISAQSMGTLFVLIINSIFTNIENQIEEIEKRKNIIEESEKKYKLLFELSGVSIGYYSTDGIIISYNKKAAENMGGTLKDFSGKSIYNIFPKAYADKYIQQIKSTLSSDVPMEYEDFVPLVTGEKWLFSTFNRIVDLKGEAIGVQIVSIDITDRKQAEERLVYSSTHDEFTDLYNRKYFEGAKEKIDTENVLTYAIIIVDINGLRLINDAFGYAEGDHLIFETVKILKSCCFNSEILARTGGDDFSILIPAGEHEANDFVEQIKNKCNAYNKSLKNKELRLSLSFGYGITNANTNVNEAQKDAFQSLNKNKLFKVKSHQNALISSMMATMYEKSHETKEHADRIALYCKMIGEKIGLTQNNMDQLYLFSMLHDIGKIGIDDRILNKPSKLTEEEWIEMKKHPEIGYRIAMSTIELKSCAEFILTHHERWDGLGYPQGLAGVDIPLLSRILAIADAYDAMMEDRVYRKAMNSDEAVAEIKKYAGTQFDPNLAQLFLELIQK